MPGNVTRNSQGKHYRWVKDRTGFMSWGREREEGKARRNSTEQEAGDTFHCRRPLKMDQLPRERSVQPERLVSADNALPLPRRQTAWVGHI